MKPTQVKSIIAIATASLLVFGLLAVLDAINSYYATRDAAEARLMATARIIEVRTQQMLRQTELFIDELSLTVRHPGPDPTFSPSSFAGSDLFTRLRSQLEQDALLRGKPQNMGVISADGVITQSTNRKVIGVNVSSRHYFQHIRANPGSDQMVIGEPVVSADGQPIFIVAKGYWKPTGELDFIVSASLPLEVFDDIIRSARPDERSGAVSIANQNLNVLARVPTIPGNPLTLTLRNAPAAKDFLNGGKTADIIDGVAALDGVSRVFAIRQSQPYSLMIGVSAARSELLLPWFRHLAIIVGVSLLVFALILTITRQAITREISRSRAEQRLRETEAELSRAQKLARIGSWRPAPDGRHMILSEQMYSLLDLKPGTEVTQDILNSYIHPDDRLDVKAAWDAARTGAGLDLIHRIVTPRGMRWVRQRGDLTFDADGQLISGVGTIQDITRLKQAEELILQSRDHYLRLLESFPTLVWRSIADGPPRYFNQTWLDFTGRGLEQEQNGGWLAAVHDDDAQMVKDGYAHGIASRETFEIEFRLRRHDGEYRWLRTIARPFLDIDGTFAGYIGTGFDTTEPRQLLEDLGRSNAELEQFAYIASHDLREPLRMISSYLNLIERRLGPQMTAELAEFFGYARDGAQRMNRLILDVLEFSRVGRLSSPVVRLSGEAPVQQAITNLAAAITESGAVITVNPLPLIQGSQDELVRLFQNLFANAIKYRQPDRSPQISVSCIPGKHMHHFMVQDNGIGIPAEQFERIFRIFQRLHVREDFGGGSGIGLAVCKKVVEFHGGKIWVTSDGTGHGSCFHFTLPAAQPLLTVSPDPREAPPAGEITSSAETAR